MGVKKKSQAVDFKKGFGQVVASNPKVWSVDRAQSVGASEVFGCIRQCRFKKLHPELATPPDEVDPEWGQTERGNVVENQFAVPCLRGMFGADQCLYMGEDQRTLVLGRLSATPDGLVVAQPRDVLSEYGVEDIGPSEQFATEVKSFGNEYMAPRRVVAADPRDPSKNVVRYEGKPRHIGQTHVQMGLFRALTNYAPDYAAIIYINPVNLKDIRTAVSKFDPEIFKRAQERAESVFDLSKSPKDFPAEGRLNSDCNYCDFVEACDTIDMARFKKGTPKPAATLPPEVATRIEELTRNVKALRAEAKEVDERKKAVEADLKEMMLENASDRIGGDSWNATLIKNKGRLSLDKDRLVEDHNINLDEYMTEGSPYFTLRVKAE